MATILERIQEKYPGKTADARNIAEALGMLYKTGGRGAGAIKDVLYDSIHIIFRPNGGVGQEMTVSVPNGITGFTFPICPFTPPEGKTFDGWAIKEDGSGDHFPAGTVLQGSITKTVGANMSVPFYAIWKDAE